MATARVVALLMLALAAPAAAQTNEPPCTLQRGDLVEIFRGVSTERATVTCGGAASTVHVIRVDLATSGLSFETSGSASGGPGVFNQDLPTAFLQRTKSQVAFNANLFTNCCCYGSQTAAAQTNLIGLEISGGTILSAVQANPPPLPNNCGQATAYSFPFDQGHEVEHREIRQRRAAASGRGGHRQPRACVG